jgi:sugar diacid utilization regulator
VLAVHEVMKLKIMDEFRLIAGASGLDRQVICTGIVDTEDLKELRETLRRGEFLITKFQLIKDQPELIVTYLKEMIDGHAACLVVKSTYFDDLPKEAIKLADVHQFPIFIFDTVYIDQLIIDINTALKASSYDERNCELVDDLLRPNMSPYSIREIALSLNRQFKDQFVIWYLKEIKQIVATRPLYFNHRNVGQILGESSMVLRYKDGYLIIATYDQVDDGQIDETLGALLDSYQFDENAMTIGKSDRKKDLGQLADAIREAMYACEYALVLEKSEAVYGQMGVYQLLLQMKNDPRVVAYYEPHIKAIKAYDSLNDTELLRTAIALVNAEGDINEAAKVLYQHGNTVRYRIKKIAKIIGGDQMKGLVYDNLTMIIRLYMLNER